MTRLYVIAALVLLGVLGFLGFGWWTAHAEKISLEVSALKQRARLEKQYDDQKMLWDSQLDAANAQAADARAKMADLERAMPVRRVTACVQQPAGQTAPVPAAGSADARHADPAAAGGVLPDAPGSGIGPSRLLDAGPALHADAVQCEAIAQRLRDWQARYRITDQ